MSYYNSDELVFVHGEYHKKKDIVQALKLMKLVEKGFEIARQTYNQEDISPDHKEHAMQIATTFQSVLDEAKR